MTTPVGRPPGRKTYTRLATGRRVPPEYELVSTDLHYNHPMRFELPAANPVAAWYYRYREGSPLQAREWQQFSDPRRTTYRGYTQLRDGREDVVDGLLRRDERDGTEGGAGGPHRAGGGRGRAGDNRGQGPGGPGRARGQERGGGGGGLGEGGKGGGGGARGGAWRGGSGGCGRRYAGRVAQEGEDFGVQPLGDLGGGSITVGRDRAGDGVVGHLGSAARQLLDQDGDRRVGAGRGQVAGHLPHGDRVAGDQPDQAAPGLVRLRVQGQHVVVVEVPGTASGQRCPAPARPAR